MCGIAGIYNSNGISRDNIGPLAEKVSECMLHRGPDSQDFYFDNNIVLIHNRLSIIDLSTGNQPISNEDGTKYIVLNGEIYNYKQLRDKLCETGHIFKSSSDTEVILHGYEEWGFEVLKKLTGMFAFAIWDKADSSIFIARDRMGEKPLYYYTDEKRFVFSSELKGIITALDKKPPINRAAMQLYFAYKFIPEPYSIYTNISKLEKASFLYVKEGRILKNQLYWNVGELIDNRNLVTDFEEAKKTLRRKLTDAVEMQLAASDVPVGVFLSGGIDSSIVAGLMSKISSKPVTSFNIGFRNKEFDETHKAKLMSEALGTNHFTYYLEFKDVMSDFDRIILNYDEPFADSSCIPTYYVSKSASDKMKVVLTGDGADELFTGYNTYDYDELIDRVTQLPRFFSFLLKNGSLDAAAILKFLSGNNSLAKRLEKFWHYQNEFGSKLELRKIFDIKNVEEFMGCNAAVIEFDKSMVCKYGLMNLNNVENSMLFDQNIILNGDMLVKVDRASMLNSLETRAPFMDKDVVEYSYNIPVCFKKRGRIKKYILKEAFSDLLPGEIIDQKKQGFSMPIGDWLRHSLKSELEELTQRELILEQGFFNPDYIQVLKNIFYGGNNDAALKLWSIFVFQKWYAETYIKDRG